MEIKVGPSGGYAHPTTDEEKDTLERWMECWFPETPKIIKARAYSLGMTGSPDTVPGSSGAV